MIQKCTELGVNAVIPLVTTRAVSLPGTREATEKRERWQKIAQEAARQCGRCRITRIHPVTSFEEIMVQPEPADYKLIFSGRAPNGLDTLADDPGALPGVSSTSQDLRAASRKKKSTVPLTRRSSPSTWVPERCEPRPPRLWRRDSCNTGLGICVKKLHHRRPQMPYTGTAKCPVCCSENQNREHCAFCGTTIAAPAPARPIPLMSQGSSLSYAGFWIRLCAFLVDVILIRTIVTALFIVGLLGYEMGSAGGISAAPLAVQSTSSGVHQR